MSQYNTSDKNSAGEKSRRVSRVEKTLSEVIGQYMSQMNHMFHGALVTLVRVSTSPDLRNAKVYISVFGGAEEGIADEVIYELEEMRPEIQRKIAKEIRMKFCPKLEFVMDDGIDKLSKVSEILNSLESNKQESKEQISESE